MARKSLVLLAIVFCSLVSTASAHYLWVTIEKDGDKPGKTHVYFEGGPGRGDGHYLDPFIKEGKTWIRTVESTKPQLLKITVSTSPGKKDKPDNRWLTAELSSTAPRSIDSYGKWGVYRYGKTDVLLHYFARHLDVATAEDLKKLARAEQMDLDIVPHVDGDTLELSVLWKGKPAAARTIYARGPKGFKENLKTDDNGVARMKIGVKGGYRFRTNVEEKADGTDNGKEYQLKRFHATLLINLPVGK